LEIVKKLITRKGPGHLFQSAHFILALLTIETKGPIGRYELGRILDLGGGSIRTLVERMKKANLVTVQGKKGHVLTEIGQKVLHEINQTLVKFDNLEAAEKITNKKFNIGCQVRAISAKIGSGITLRDAAIAGGSKSGVIISLIYTEKGFNLPTFEERYLEKEFPELIQSILLKFDFQKEDGLIICGADTIIEAKLGAITAVLSLFNH
jgi:DNA-binding MarR family transcriptional regulator